MKTKFKYLAAAILATLLISWGISKISDSKTVMSVQDEQSKSSYQQTHHSGFTPAVFNLFKML